MGGLLEVAEVPGFLEDIEEMLSQADIETRIWGEFVELWAETFGEKALFTKDLYSLANHKDLLLEVLGDKGPRSEKRKLGKSLRNLTGRQFGAWRIVFAGKDSHTKHNLYKLEKSCGKLNP